MKKKSCLSLNSPRNKNIPKRGNGKEKKNWKMNQVITKITLTNEIQYYHLLAGRV